MEDEIYNADRSADFVIMLSKVLKKTKLKDSLIKKFLNKKNVDMYGRAFTSEAASTTDNFRLYKYLGGVCVKQFMAWYLYNRFPQLQCDRGVSVLSTVKSNYTSTETLATIAESYGFWDFISATEPERNRNKQGLLEGVFEAFVGVTVLLLDTAVKNGIGYSIVSNMLKTEYDAHTIDITYEAVVDPKTRLNDLVAFFEKNNKNIGVIKYVPKQRDGGMQTTEVVAVDGKKHTVLGTGTAPGGKAAAQAAAENALAGLKAKGITKRPPSIYTKGCDGLKA